jgi:hypothetical protein
VVPGAWLCRVRWTRNAVFLAENQFGVSAAGHTLNQADTNGIAGAYAAAFASTLGSVNGLSSKWSPVSMSVLDITTATGPEFLSAVGGVGSSGGDDLPPQCAIVTKFTTALRGRRYRGRNFIPGIPESAQDGGVLSTFLVAQVESFWADFQTNLAAYASAIQMGVISRKFKLFTPITGFTTTQKVFTQRRRASH